MAKWLTNHALALFLAACSSMLWIGGAVWWTAVTVTEVEERSARNEHAQAKHEEGSGHSQTREQLVRIETRQQAIIERLDGIKSEMVRGR